MRSRCHSRQFEGVLFNIHIANTATSNRIDLLILSVHNKHNIELHELYITCMSATLISLYESQRRSAGVDVSAGKQGGKEALDAFLVSSLEDYIKANHERLHQILITKVPMFFQCFDTVQDFVSNVWTKDSYTGKTSQLELLL